MLSIGNYEFSNSELLGHGAFALVYKGNKKGCVDELVAIKKIRKSSFSCLFSKELKEISILSGLIHENIVRMHDFLETPSDIFLVLEFCNMGDLNEFLHKYNRLSEDAIRYIFKQIGMAITFLHKSQIIHRDLKPQNILLHSNDDFSIVSPFSPIIPNKRLIAKIGDFGFARVLADTTMATTLCGSPLYMAPEILLGKNYDSKVDMWSIGTIIYQCFTGSAPFLAKTPLLLRKLYETDQNLQPELPLEASPDLNSLFLSLLKRDSRLRLDYSEFCSHPFFYKLLLQTRPDTGNAAHKPVRNGLKFSSNAVEMLQDGSICISRKHMQSCDQNFMFASPEVYAPNTNQYSISPPSNFLASPSSLICKLPEVIPDSTGFVLLPTTMGDSPRSENLFLSSLPESLESNVDSPDTRFYSKEKIPFSHLIPNCDQIIDWNYNPTDYEDAVHLSGFDPLEKMDHCFRIHDVSCVSTLISVSEPKYNVLSDHNSSFVTTNSAEVTTGSYIPTMFIQHDNVGSVNNFNMLDALPPLQSLQCPYESFSKTIPNQDGEILNLDNDTILSGTGFPVNEDDSLEFQLQFSDDITIYDIEYSNSNRETLNCSIPCLEKNLQDQIEDCIKMSNYIVYMMSLLRSPSLSLSNYKRNFSSQKSNVCYILKKLVLLVKVVKVMFKIVKHVNLKRSQLEMTDSSLLSPYFESFARLLEFCQNDMYQNKVFYIESAKRMEVYYSCIPSAETLIYNEIVDICQNAILEHIFDQNVCKQKTRFVNVSLLCDEISKLCEDEDILSFTPFTEYSHRISINQICI